MVTGVKDLARMLDREPKWIRAVLRKHYKRPVGRRWRFTDKEAAEVRAFLRQYLQGDGQ